MTLDFQDGLKLEIDAVAVSLDVENTLHRLDTFGGGTAVIGKTTRISVIADVVDCVMAEPEGRPGPGVEALIRTIRFMKKGRGNDQQGYVEKSGRKGSEILWEHEDSAIRR